MSDSSLPVCSADPKLDLGHGVTAELRRIDGKPDGVAYWHPCRGGEIAEGYCPVKGRGWSDGWDLLSEAPLTLAPSLLCRVCGHHGFIRSGKWVPV